MNFKHTGGFAGSNALENAYNKTDFAQQSPAPLPKRLYLVSFESGEPEYVVATSVFTVLREYECTQSDKGRITEITELAGAVIVGL